MIPPGAPHLPSPGVFLFQAALLPAGNITCKAKQRERVPSSPLAQGTTGDGDGRWGYGDRRDAACRRLDGAASESWPSPRVTTAELKRVPPQHPFSHSLGRS